MCLWYISGIQDIDCIGFRRMYCAQVKHENLYISRKKQRNKYKPDVVLQNMEFVDFLEMYRIPIYSYSCKICVIKFNVAHLSAC